MDPGVAVGDEREVHDLAEAVREDLGEVVHHEARRVGAQRLVVQRHGHLPAVRGSGGGGGEQEERGDGEAAVHSVGSVGMPRSSVRMRGKLIVARRGHVRRAPGAVLLPDEHTGPTSATWARRVSHEQRPQGPAWAVGLVIRERGRDPGRDWRASACAKRKRACDCPHCRRFFFLLTPPLFRFALYKNKINFKPLLSTPHSHLDTQYKIKSTAAMHMHLITMSKQLIITWAGDRERSAVDD